MTNTPGTTPGFTVHRPDCDCHGCAYDRMLIAELEADNRAERRELGI